MENIGSHIKEVRKSKGITLAELSGKTQLSIAYLSKMERGLNQVTVTNLNNICKALELDLASMLTHSNDNHTIVRGSNREIIHEDEFIRLESLCDPQQTGLTFSCTVVKQNDPHLRPHSHAFDEVGIIISGTLNVVIEGISHILYTGDCIHVRAHAPRQMEKIGDMPCVSYWIHLPPQKN